MTGLIDKALDKGPRIAEELLTQPFHAVVGFTQGGFVIAARQADTATPGGAFQHHRIANLSGGVDRLLNAVQQASARRHRHLRQRRQLTRPVFQAELANLCRRRADKSDARRFAGVGKLSALGKEPVAGVDRLRAGFCRRRQDLVDTQVAVAGFFTAQRHRQIGCGDVRCIAVGVGINRHAGHSQSFQGADGAAGNFATVGNQYGRKHDQAPFRLAT
ncbi:hypothetical protein D3C81_1069220 [compost metagenome]